MKVRVYVAITVLFAAAVIAVFVTHEAARPETRAADVRELHIWLDDGFSISVDQHKRLDVLGMRADEAKAELAALGFVRVGDSPDAMFARDESTIWVDDAGKVSDMYLTAWTGDRGDRHALVFHRDDGRTMFVYSDTRLVDIAHFFGESDAELLGGVYGVSGGVSRGNYMEITTCGSPKYDDDMNVISDSDSYLVRIQAERRKQDGRDQRTGSRGDRVRFKK